MFFEASDFKAPTPSCTAYFQLNVSFLEIISIEIIQIAKCHSEIIKEKDSLGTILFNAHIPLQTIFHFMNNQQKIRIIGMYA